MKIKLKCLTDINAQLKPRLNFSGKKKLCLKIKGVDLGQVQDTELLKVH